MHYGRMISILIFTVIGLYWPITSASHSIRSSLLHEEFSYPLYQDSSSIPNSRQNALKRCYALYAEAASRFDDNFNFTSIPMLKTLTEVRDIAERYPNADTLLSDVYGKMAICYQDLGRDDEAVAALRKAKSLRRNRIHDRSLFNICLTLGNLFMKTYEYDSAEYYFMFIEDQLAGFRGLRKNEYHRLWNELGVLHYNYGDYRLALNYYEQALQNGLSIFPPEAESIVRLQNNIIAALLKLDRFQEAIRKYRALLSYNQTLPILYHNLGKTYQRIGRYDSALFYLKKAGQKAASDEVLKIKLFNNLGITYAGLKDYDQALRYLDYSISLNHKFYKTKNAALAYSYMNKAKIYEQRSKIRSALLEYHAALNILHFDFNDSSFYTSPKDLNNVVSRPYFFECLHNKAAAFREYYNESLQHRDLLAAFSNYELAIEMMDIIRKSYSSQEAKLLFSDKTHSVYGEAVTVAVELYESTRDVKYKEAAFAFSEKSKMTVLSEALGDLQFKKISGIPGDLIRQEQKLKQTISRLLIRLSDAKDSLQSLKIRSDLTASEINLSKIQHQLEQNERYRNLRYDTKPLPEEDIRGQLQDNEALIEYYLTEREAFIFIATPEELIVKRVPLSSTFFDAFKDWKTSLHSAEDGRPYRAMKASHTVYKFLIAPVIPYAGDKKRWIIVPDGMLHYVPIEALISDTTQNRFVIEDHAVRYGYSSAFLFLTPKYDRYADKGSVLAFAPFDSPLKNRTAIQHLKASRREIQSLSGKHYFNEAATKAAFLEQAGSFDIIHLATHAETSSENPIHSFIAFFPVSQQEEYNSRLYMPEIYTLDLHQTRMVVISACEAGGGKLMKGEGLISLSRAFAFAGCSGIITSLWKADDESCATIMSSMHQHLRDGYTRDEALQKAKLEYLRSDHSSRLQSPVFWANFVCIGDADVLYENHTARYTLVGFVIFSFFLAMVFLKVRINRAKSRNR